MNLKEIFKPRLKQLVLFVILSFPFLFSLPPQFYIIKSYVSTVQGLLFIPLLIINCSLGGGCMDINPGAVGSEWLPTISMFTVVVIILFLNCCITIIVISIWNKIFQFFGDKGKLYEKIVFIIAIFFIIILPLTTNIFVTTNKNTLSTVKLTEIFDGQNKSSGDLFASNGAALEELSIKNNFILPIMYELPGVTACTYDSKNKIIYNFQAEYQTSDGWVRKMTEPPTPNTILIQPFSLTKVSLRSYGGWANKGEIHDTVLIFRNTKMGRFNSCDNFSEKDVINAEKIKIIQ